MERFASIIETVPVPCRVVGTALRPFCLGHHLLLTRLGSAYADNPNAKTTTHELLRAIFICAHSYEETIEGQLNGEWTNAATLWMAAVIKKKPDFAAARDIFQKHLADGYRIAPVWRHVSPAGGVTLSAPWEQLMKIRLVAAGFSLPEVMNGYLPERWYDYFTVMELRLADTIQNQKDWKPIFYTLQDALDSERSKSPQPAAEVEPLPK